jgi:hypothetical protein
MRVVRTGQKRGPVLSWHEQQEPDSPKALSETKLNEKPVWDKEKSELRFQGVSCRYRPIATNCISILAAFQEEDWPVRIDDPLPTGRNSERLLATIRQLNKRLRTLRFVADGSGQGIAWEASSTVNDSI